MANLSQSSFADQTPLNRIDLFGTWQVRMDDSSHAADDHAANDDTGNDDATNDDAATRENQSRHNGMLHEVQLPGTLRDSGVGIPPGPDTPWIASTQESLWNQPEYAPYREQDNFKFPFWLQPNLHYVGGATYQRQIEIPNQWRDQRIILTLERPHWQTSVLVDGKLITGGDSLSTAHRFDLTNALPPGKHELAIVVNNSLQPIDVGINSHSVSDHTQSAWHGIVGEISLTAHPMVDIDHINIHPNVDKHSVATQSILVNRFDKPRSCSLLMEVTQNGRSLAKHQSDIELAPGENIIEKTMLLDAQAQLWDEFSPELCELTASLLPKDSGTPAPSTTSSWSGTSSWLGTFGFRKIEARDGKLQLNGRPIFLRGTLECCIFPLTGYPPTDVASWKRIIRICKQHGLNHIRFHSWCPPEAAFVAADELGFYFQVECSTWPNRSVGLGYGRPVDEWLYREGDRVLTAYANHPSFLLFCAGNEPGGPGNGGDFLGPWVEHFKQQEDRVLVTSGAGWPSIRENEYHLTPKPRIQQWGQGLKSRINARAPETTTDYSDFISRQSAPVVAHEIGQWCVYPNFDEIEKYTGALRPKNFEIFRDFLTQSGMLHQARDFLMASGRLQVLTYKEEIESALRTKNFGGFQLLDLHDFPGQGTATVGMLDPFWDPKPYMNTSEFRGFCGPVIPLARMPKRVWRGQEQFSAEVEISHFGNQPLQGKATWKIRRSPSPRNPDFAETSDSNAAVNKPAKESQATQTVLAQGSWQLTGQAPGDLYRIGEIRCELDSITNAGKYVLEVTIPDGKDTITNRWDFWVYPSIDADAPTTTGSVTLATNLDDALDATARGERVLLNLPADRVATDVKIGMSPIFWNWAWTNGQAPHTMGILCDPSHACLRDFPTDDHSNWQWWELVSRSATMHLDQLPTEIDPIIQVVPNWFVPQKLALAFEARMGNGSLLATSIDLQNDLDQRPVAQRLRRSMIDYIASERFAPAASLSKPQLRSLLRQPSPTEQATQSINASSMQPGYEAYRAIDGQNQTMWHSAWNPASPPPHWIELTLRESRLVEGVQITPRKDISRTRFRQYTISTQDGSGTWTTAATGTLDGSAATETLRFDKPMKCDAVRIQTDTPASASPGGPIKNFHASVAELQLLLSK
ncbi:discoidin domain-containing protein [Rhodopirellula sallentina]|uniref:Glycosyl hydrolase family 2, sugar binding domain protein n=1 Tax=Rhodopirellula sallentina SM41 TaxID=1263870 RepID=M5TVQ6_9BACT|nr:discoidin domain-containing protein [Rhodopirellula sallentina]EMI53134.1 glycosyl hydrolase family 2, sugar binding domain protein [Rhodopirellula sallentina SM41]